MPYDQFLGCLVSFGGHKPVRIILDSRQVKLPAPVCQQAGTGEAPSRLACGQDEMTYFLDGRVKISRNGKEVQVSTSNCDYIPSGCEYRYYGQTDATMVCVFSRPTE